MSTPLFSKLMTIVIDASTVGCATDFTLSISKDVIEIACLGSTGAKESIPDLYGWNVAGNALVLRTADSGQSGMMEAANKLLTTDASVTVRLLPDISTFKYYSGSGYFTSLSMNGGVGAPVTWSFEITGSGPLSILTTN